jgi:hypothetical protein
MNELLVLPGEAAEKNGRLVTLGFGKGAFDGFVEMLDGAPLQARFSLEAPSFLVDALADQPLFGRDLD